MVPLVIVFVLGIFGVLFAFWLARNVLARDTGTPEMQQVASAIYEGAMAFMRRQYGTIIMLALVGCVVVGAVIAAVEGSVGLGAGRGAALFESPAAENIGAMIRGVAVYAFIRRANLPIPNPEYWIFFPLVVRAFGIIASAAGLLVVRAREGENAMNALNRGYYLAAGLSAVFLVVAA